MGENQKTPLEGMVQQKIREFRQNVELSSNTVEDDFLSKILRNDTFTVAQWNKRLGIPSHILRKSAGCFLAQFISSPVSKKTALLMGMEKFPAIILSQKEIKIALDNIQKKFCNSTELEKEFQSWSLLMDQLTISLNLSELSLESAYNFFQSFAYDSQLKQKYHQIILKKHPDRIPLKSLDPLFTSLAHENFILIQKAFCLIQNHEKNLKKVA